MRSYIFEDISLMTALVLKAGHPSKERILSTRLDPKARSMMGAQLNVEQ